MPTLVKKFTPFLYDSLIVIMTEMGRVERWKNGKCTWKFNN